MSNNRRRAIVASFVAGILLVAFLQAWQHRPSVLQDHDWGNARGSGVLNAVRSLGRFDRESGRFSYYTGARSGDDGPLSAAPTRVIAEAVDGSVSVRLLGLAAYEPAGAADDARELARIVSLATTSVYPAAAIPIEIDVHFMSAGTRFSLAKRVDWREGRAYELAVFHREQAFDPTTAAHELYHVLEKRWSLLETAEAARRPGAALSFAEAAAELYAACGQLLAVGMLERPQATRARVTIQDEVPGDRAFVGALAGEELRAALELMRIGANGRGLIGFGPLFAATAFEALFAEASDLTLGSPEASRLLALCRQAAADPFALEAWLAAL